MDGYLSISEVARRLGLSRVSVYGLIAKGVLTLDRQSRQRQIRADEVAELQWRRIEA